MNRQGDSRPIGDVRGARSLFPATDRAAYFNTAAVGLASQTLLAVYHNFVDDWAEPGLDYVRGEAAGESARTSTAEPSRLLADLKRRGVMCSARDGNLRLAIHFYNHEDDIHQVASALSELRTEFR